MPAPVLDSDTIVLIVEPNTGLKTPYSFIEGVWDIRRIASIDGAIEATLAKPPELVLLSASFDPSQTVKFLETLREVSVFRIIPLLVIVDLSCRISNVLGTSWGDRIAVIDCNITKKDFLSTIERITANSTPVIIQ